MSIPLISLSVVSHGQAELVAALLNDLRVSCDVAAMEVVLTLNVPEDLPEAIKDCSFPLTIIRNPTPLGFAQNHNNAFTQARGRFFCVINPDIRLTADVFPSLIAALVDKSLGVVAPRIIGGNGQVEDSARHFPTPWAILLKGLGNPGRSSYSSFQQAFCPDWIGGMFMLFRSEVFQAMNGFDTKFFLYYEDVDLCARIWQAGLRVMQLPQLQIVHNARRSSHKSWHYFRLHVVSMVKFFCSRVFIKILLGRRPRGDAQSVY